MMNIYSNFSKSYLLIAIAICFAGKSNSQSVSFRALVIASADKDHAKMIAVAEPFFNRIAAGNNFSVVFTKDTSVLNDSSLANYQVVIQLQLAPFDMSYSQQAALQKFIQQGRGWVGIHAAGLTGKSFLAPGTVYWQWFQDFMGGILYSPHPAFQKGTVIMEDRTHPATKNMPAQFEISDEWYEFDRSPRRDVHVLARADESSYKQNKPMGDHPIIWTNEKFDRMIYIGVGHDASVCTNAAYTILIRDAILWAASPVGKSK
jgi:type 1 glutamine amidotransferase